MDKPKIVFDRRDTDRGTKLHRWASLAEEELHIKADVVIETLSLGDISWQGKSRPHLAEIKTTRDFVDSVTSGHLQDQIARMIEWRDIDCGGVATIHLIIIGMLGIDDKGYVTYCTDDVPVLSTDGINALFGSPHTSGVMKFNSGFRPYNMFSNYLISLQEMGVAVHHTAPNVFGKMFMGMYNHSTKSRHSIPSRRQVSVLTGEQQALMAISPSLRVAGAKSLLSYFGTLADIAVQDIPSLVQAKGVGNVSAGEIYNGFRKERNQIG